MQCENLGCTRISRKKNNSENLTNFKTHRLLIHKSLDMQSKSLNAEAYMNELPEERKAAILKLRNEINQNIPEGFKEIVNYGMIGWAVPHSVYASGYHCDPKQPLPFMNLASRKNFIAVYHMGIYANKKLLEWFTAEYEKSCGKKPDMGKSCIRFKKPASIPYEVIGKLAAKMSVEDWISIYEKYKP